MWSIPDPWNLRSQPELWFLQRKESFLRKRELGDGMYGTIGIIGPKRMDYENVVDSLKELKNHLDDVLKKKKT